MTAERGFLKVVNLWFRFIIL